MVTVLVFSESRFPVDRSKLRIFCEKYLQHKISGAVEVSISIVGDRKMKLLNSKYRSIESTTDVLAFPLDDSANSSLKDLQSGFSPDKSYPDKVLRLGDVVMSYPQAVLEAVDMNTLVNTQIEALVSHGLDHLLGIHHPEN